MWPTHYIPQQARIDGVPPPRFYLTTPPYAMEVVEDVTSGAGTFSIGFVPSTETTESVLGSGAPVSGTMAVLLKSLSVLPDHIQSSGLPLSGVLDAILVLADAGIERVTSSGLPLHGTLGDGPPIITYTNWPLGYDQEDLISSGLPLYGSLT